jgi:hypothetical protein
MGGGAPRIQMQSHLLIADLIGLKSAFNSPCCNWKAVNPLLFKIERLLLPSTLERCFKLLHSRYELLPFRSSQARPCVSQARQKPASAWSLRPY